MYTQNTINKFLSQIQITDSSKDAFYGHNFAAQWCSGIGGFDGSGGVRASSSSAAAYSPPPPPPPLQKILTSFYILCGPHWAAQGGPGMGPATPLHWCTLWMYRSTGKQPEILHKPDNKIPLLKQKDNNVTNIKTCPFQKAVIFASVPIHVFDFDANKCRTICWPTVDACGLSLILVTVLTSQILSEDVPARKTSIMLLLTV